MTLFKLLLLTIFLATCQPAYSAGTYIKGPVLVEGFTTVTSAAGTTTLTKDSETKQILTGATTQTFVLPDATTVPLGRYFNMINKSSGIMTVQTSGGGALTTVDPGVQKEVHLRAAGSAAGTWDVLAGGGGGVWGSITGTLSAQTDLNTALGLKAPAASPTFTGTIGTPLTASKLLATDASGNLTATAANSSQASYLDFSSSGQTQLNGKLGLSNFAAKGDIVAGVSSGTVSATSLGTEGSVLVSDPNNITNGIRWGNLPGQENYIKNSQLESGSTTGWATYADAAGTQPVDCTGGSPNTTIAASSSSPLNGTYSLLATLNTGASRQGEGFSYAFSIPSKYSTSPGVHQIEFDYGGIGGTFVAGNDTDRTTAGDSTYTVWIYDVTNAQLIQPSTYRMYSNVGGKVVTNFQNNAGSTSYRLCIHKGTTTSVSGTNITVKFDDFRVNETRYVYGTPISDWVSYTYTGFTSTNGVVSSKWRRVGDTMEIQQNVEWSNTAGAFSGVFGLPSGYSIDTSKLGLSTLGVDRTLLGRAQFLDSGAFIYDGLVTYRDTTTVNVWQVDASSPSARNTIITASSPFSFGANDTINLKYSVPITGWSSSTQQSDGYDGRQIAARYTTTQTTSITASDTLVNFDTLVYDKAASVTTGASWKFTANSPGLYVVKASLNIPTVTLTTTQSLGLRLYKNGVSNHELARVPGNGVSRNYQASGSTTIELNAGDYITLYAFCDTTANMSANGTLTWISIEKLQSPQTMSATEVVAARYTTAAGQSIPNTAANTIVNYDTKVYDTHNAVTTGASWKFTAPAFGFYRVTVMSHYSSSVWAAGNAAYGSIYKNGSVYVTVDDPPIQAACTDAIPVKGVTTVLLNAGDYIDYEIANTRTAGATTLTTSSALNYIEIERIK